MDYGNVAHRGVQYLHTLKNLSVPSLQMDGILIPINTYWNVVIYNN